MDSFKRAVWIIGSVLVAIVLLLVVVCLWALNRKADNINRIAPAAQKRWAGKEELKPKNENGTELPEVDARPVNGRTYTLAAVDADKRDEGTSDAASQSS